MDVAVRDCKPAGKLDFTIRFKELFLAFFLGSKRAVAEVWEDTSRIVFSPLYSNTFQNQFCTFVLIASQGGN